MRQEQFITHSSKKQKTEAPTRRNSCPFSLLYFLVLLFVTFNTFFLSLVLLLHVD